MKVRAHVCALAVIAVIGGSGVLRAQTHAARATVTGTVTDATTGLPVVAAELRLLPSHAVDVAHADGRFYFRDIEPGNYTLVVQRIGYQSVHRLVTLSAGQTLTVNVGLSVAALEVGALVVTGTLAPRAQQDVISPTSAITAAELDRRSSQTVAQTIENTPGVAVSSLGPATSRPVIRGLGGDRILILEDGQRPGDLSSMSSDHAVAIEPIAARRIEIVRGPMSLLYGSSALGGVVNVVRDEIPDSRPHESQGSFSVQGESVNRGATAGGHLLTHLGAFAVRGEATFRNAGDLHTPAGPVINTGARTYDLGLGAGLPADHGHGGVAYRFYKNDYGVPGGFVGGHPTGVDISMRRHNTRFRTELHRDEGFLNTLSFDGGYTNYQHAEFEPSGAIGTDFRQNVVQGEVLARHRGQGKLTEGAVGARMQYRDVQTGGTLRTPATYDYSAAVFAIEEIGTGPLRLQGGLRYDFAHYVPRDTTAFVSAGGKRIPVRARSFGSVSGSGGVLWHAAEALRLGASVSRAYRTPDFNELFSNGPHLAANSFDVGDPLLKQETGFGVDAFVRVSTSRLNAEVAAYRNVLHDYIFPSSRGRAELGAQGGRPRFQYTNEDARFRGLEGSFDLTIAPSIQFEASGSAVQAEFTSGRAPIPVFDGFDTTFVAASKYPPLIPPAQAHLGVRFERTTHFLGIGTKLVASQQRTGDFETPTAGYNLVDANAGVRIAKGAFLHTITLRVDNIFNQSYRDHLSRLKEIMPGAGRNISLLYRATF